MTIYHAAAIFEPTNGLPEDRAQNNFYFEGSGVPAVEAALISAAVQEFYNVASGPQAALATRLSDELSRVALASLVRIWTVNEVTGVETFLFEQAWTLGAASNAVALPSETAVVLSFHGVLDGSDADRRKRGRIYLGPLNQGASADTALAALRPGVGVMEGLRDAAQELQSSVQANAIDWVVWSDAGKFATVITAGWTDNAFDTQRRRGPAPTVRDVVAIP